MSGFNYYEILGVTQQASTVEIKQAYRKTMAALHPDRAGNGATTMAAMVNEAGSVLTDPRRRATYDKSLRQAATPPLPQPAPAKVDVEWGVEEEIEVTVNDASCTTPQPESTTQSDDSDLDVIGYLVFGIIPIAIAVLIQVLIAGVVGPGMGKVWLAAALLIIPALMPRFPFSGLLRFGLALLSISMWWSAVQQVGWIHGSVNWRLAVGMLEIVLIIVGALILAVARSQQKQDQ